LISLVGRRRKFLGRRLSQLAFRKVPLTSLHPLSLYLSASTPHSVRENHMEHYMIVMRGPGSDQVIDNAGDWCVRISSFEIAQTLHQVHMHAVNSGAIVLLLTSYGRWDVIWQAGYSRGEEPFRALWLN
jgi:hypothetical protein